ncbi:hypothetical protein ACNKHO_00660 [Shigella flexneri]
MGFTNVDSQGIEGVEKSFDKWLTGQPGERIVRKTAMVASLKTFPRRTARPRTTWP